jgi:signal transduction histidine kinase
MLRMGNLASRAVALVLVGVFTFMSPWKHPAALAVSIIAFVIAALVIIWLSFLDEMPASRARYESLLPYVFSAVTMSCGLASAAGPGWRLIFLGFIAAVQAGMDMSMTAGYVIVGLGILSIESLGLPTHQDLWVTVAFPGVLVLGFVSGFNRRFWRFEVVQAEALLAKSEQLREEQATVATLEERTRIAREIHDVLAHSLGALGLHIELIRAVLTDQNDVSRAVELLDQAHRMATDGLTETRRAVHALRGETRPLPEGLAALSADHQLRHGTRVQFEVSGVPRQLPVDAGLAIARTAQEALVNTAKHAPHQPVKMCLDYAEDTTSLMVVNHLGGDEHEPGLATVNGGYGLAGMRERLRLLDGTLSAGRDGTDWVVVAKVPQRASEQKPAQRASEQKPAQ